MCDGKRNLAKEELNYPEDVLSGVADVLLTRVLSFLPMKTAIRTNILTTRWTSLWATVPRLELTISNFLPRGMDLYSQLRRKANFLAFVQRFLRRNSPCYIKSLNLYCWLANFRPWKFQMSFLFGPMITRIVLSFLEKRLRSVGMIWNHGRVLLKGSKCLVLPFPVRRICHSPANYAQISFGLKIWWFWNSGVPDFNIPVALVCFPKLKVLRLEDIRFKDNYSVSNLINYCCPVLEELFVSSADGENVFRPLVITAKSLTQLELEFVPEEEEDDNHDNHDVDDVDSMITVSGTRIDVPALQYLRLQNVLITGNDVAGVLGALDEANLDVYSEDDLFWLLVRIRNVKMLTLSEATLMSIGSSKLPLFLNLTCLEIEQSDAHIVRWETVVKVLKNMHILEYLCFEGVSFEEGSVLDWFDCKAEHYVPRCLTKCLKTIEISSIHGDDNELKIVEYFLKHSRVLQKMEVVVVKSCSSKRKIKERILKLLKGSPECDVVITSAI